MPTETTTPNTHAAEVTETVAAGLPHPNAQYALAAAQEDYVRAKDVLHNAGLALERAADTLAHAKSLFYGRVPVVTGILTPTDFDPHVAHQDARAGQDGGDGSAAANAAEAAANAAEAAANGAGQDGNALRASAALLAANPVFVNADEVRQQSVEADPTGDKARGGGPADTGAADESAALGG